jgi:V-type H+-transporting ATPase subunit a
VGKVRDPATGEEQQKSVFAVFFAGDRAKTKVMKVCSWSG